MYFTMVPNYILNHSSAIDQALYLQMKRFAGEKNGGGNCAASHRTLMKKLKIGHPVLKRSLKYLLDHKWIEELGTRKVQTEGGIVEVQVYRVNDIWKLNADYYQGVAKSTHLSEVLLSSNGGVAENAQGVATQQPIKNVLRTKELVVTTVPTERESERIRIPPKYPHSKEVFSWFPRPQKNWAINKTELAHAELLWERGEKAVKSALQYANKHKSDVYFPVVGSPSELERKWETMKSYAERN